MAEMNDDELLDALGIEVAPLQITSHTPREQRIIAGFEDILRFQHSHGRTPQHGEDGDIFERLYAVRLDQLRKLPEAQSLLADLDIHDLLSQTSATLADVDALNDADLLAELGVESEVQAQSDITVLRHVRPYAEIQAAEEVAQRKPCVDFGQFQHLFEGAVAGLEEGTWMTKPFVKNASIEIGDFFIISGQIAYVAEILEGNQTKDGRDNPRLRVIFDNHT